MHALFAYATSREVEPFAAALPWTLATGVGKAAAAAAVARALASRRASLVCLIGVAGSYADDLDVGSVCVVESAVFADEGTSAGDGFSSVADLGFAAEIGPSHDAARAARVRDALALPGVRCATVSTCSGTDALAAEYVARTGAEIETMESAAVAVACAAEGVPLVELRAISNRCGARERGGWDIGLAVRALGENVRLLLASGCLDG